MSSSDRSRDGMNIRPEPSPASADDAKTVAEPAADSSSKSGSLHVPDHELRMKIGQGSYGEVWLARNVMGTYRAVKVVYRAAFEHARPFEREFNGIQKFEPISRSHDGFVDVLQVGRTADYFYYVMELADDVSAGQQFDPAKYQPKTLRSQMQGQKPLSLPHCVELGLSLTAALSHLHGRGLIHRDVKPSNIIFVNELPKLADIGLVAEQNEAKSFVGTEGFIPPEGPGTPQADIYSLGKVLYEMATGKDRHEFPALPCLADDPETETELLELNAVVQKACQPDLSHRYATADAMREDLLLLRSGKSVKRAQRNERRLTLLARISVVGLLCTLGISAAYFYAHRQALVESRLRQEALRERSRAEAQELATHRTAYDSDMNLAQQALSVNNLGRARQLVNRYWPIEGGTDLRGWEWRYLWKRCQGDAWFELGRHSNAVSRVQYSADGKSLAVGDAAGFIDVWDVANWRLIGSYSHPGWVRGLAFSATGNLLVSAAANSIKIWNTATQAMIADLKHDGLIRSFELSPDGKTFATFGQNGIVRLWDFTSHQVLATISDLSSPYGDHPGTFAFSPNGRLLAIGEANGRVRLVDPGTAQEKLAFQAHRDGITTLAFSPDSELLATGAGYSETSVLLWNVASGQSAGELKGHSEWIACLSFSPDGKHLASASADQIIRIWDLASQQAVAVLRGHLLEVWAVAYAPNGEELISGCKDGAIAVWKSATTGRTDSYLTSSTPIRSFGFTPQGTNLWVVAQDGSIRRWDAETLGEQEHLVSLGTKNLGLALAPNGRWIAASGSDARVTIWDVAESRVLSLLPVQGGPTAAHFTSACDKLITFEIGTGNTALWNTRDWREITRWTARPGAMTPSPDSATLAVWGPQGMVSLWDMQSGRLKVEFRAHRQNVSDAAFSPDGRLLATVCSDGTMHLWDSSTGHLKLSLSGHILGVHSVAFSPDGRRLATGSGGRETVKLWDLVTCQEVATLTGQGFLVNLISFSADGNALAAQNNQGKLHLWRAPSLAEINTALAAPTRVGGR